MAHAFRYLRHRGWQVTYVRNYTDVDDKIILRARRRGEDPLAMARHFIEAFRKDMADLGLLPPDREPTVSGNMEAIIDATERLVAKKSAYLADGNVWFSVASFPSYGAFSGQRPDAMRPSSEREGGKRDPKDFALWKAARPGEPNWPSPFGPGRPGWHIECSAMAHEELGEGIDIHGGGIDLVFPHHENEIAQSEAAYGALPYAQHFMHAGLLTTEKGDKIARSVGNGATIREALAKYPAEALRLYYMQAHYRSPLPWNEASLDEALAVLGRLYDARASASSLVSAAGQDPTHDSDLLGPDAHAVMDLASAFEGRFYEAMGQYERAHAIRSKLENAGIEVLDGLSRARWRIGGSSGKAS